LDHGQLALPEGLDRAITAYQTWISTLKNPDPTKTGTLPRTSSRKIGDKPTTETIGEIPINIQEDEENWEEQSQFSGIETISYVVGDELGEDLGAASRTFLPNQNTGKKRPRLPITRTKKVPPRRNEPTKLGDMNMKDLSDMIQNIMMSSLNNLTQTQAQAQTHGASLNYTVAPRPRYHLVDLKTFTGKSEDYPVWRQNLDICIERETFRDEKDKALFVLNHLSGAPYEHCKSYVRTLTGASYQNMVGKLERLYGSTKVLDMSLILKINKLPKVNYLSKENLDVMITVIESAIDPLKKMDPTALTSPINEKYLRLLTLIPSNDQDTYDTFCVVRNMEQNLESFLEFLYKKHEIRRTSDEIAKHTQTGRQDMKIMKLTKDHDEVSEQEEDPLYAVQERSYKVTCGACKGPHGLAVCEKFKSLIIDERRKVVDDCRACSSCLRIGHFVRTCRIRKRCTVPNCTRNHHPLLHDDYLMRIMYFEEVGGHPDEQ